MDTATPDAFVFVDLGGGSYRITLTADTTCTITVTATDVAGNVTTETTTFTVVDTTAPSLALTAPANASADGTAAARIAFRHNSGAFGRKYLPETMGSGLALFDYDNDGWLDLYANSYDRTLGDAVKYLIPNSRIEIEFHLFDVVRRIETNLKIDLRQNTLYGFNFARNARPRRAPRR